MSNLSFLKHLKFLPALALFSKKEGSKFRRITRPRFATRKNSVFGYYLGTNIEPNRGLLLDSSNIRIGTLKFGFYNSCFDFGQFLASDFKSGWYSCFD